jgi:hypothetical protein
MNLGLVHGMGRRADAIARLPLQADGCGKRCQARDPRLRHHRLRDGGYRWKADGAQHKI